jgi:hypothetical protein
MEFTQPKEKVLVALVLLLGIAFGFQTYQLNESRIHHHFAIITAEEVMGVAMRCESTKEQCCK